LSKSREKIADEPPVSLAKPWTENNDDQRDKPMDFCWVPYLQANPNPQLIH